MWLMIWMVMAANGTFTSGSLEFPTKAACEAATQTFGASAGQMAIKVTPLPDTRITCIERATGKP